MTRRTQRKTNGARRDPRTLPVPETIRVVIADDQAMDRAGLKMLLSSQSDIEVIAEATYRSETEERCRALQPDVLVLSTRLPGQEEASVIPAVAAVSPATRVLAVAERGEWRCMALNPPRRGQPRSPSVPCGPVSDCLQMAVARGAHGAIRRSADPEDFFRAIRALASGHEWYELGTASRMLARALGLASDGDAKTLSPREEQVAGLIAEGHSNKEIAHDLGISLPTVKKHVCHILEKLGLQDRLQVGLHLARNPLMLYRPDSGPRA